MIRINEFEAILTIYEKNHFYNFFVLARYGYGAEGIIEMKAVLSDGNLVTVTPDKTIFADGRYVMSFKGLGR